MTDISTAYGFLRLRPGASPKELREAYEYLKGETNDQVTLRACYDYAVAHALQMRCDTCLGGGVIQGAMRYATGRPVEHLCGSCNGTGRKFNE